MPNSYLSSNVYDFFCLTKSKIQLKSNTKYVLSNYTLNINELNHIFSDCSDENFDIHSQNNDWYIEKLKIVHKIMCECENIMQNTCTEKILENCIWTNQISDIKVCFDYYGSKNESNWLKCVLILSSLLERSLGNVYKIHNKNVPFLLRDLLETKYLFEILNYGLIRLMQIIFGTPKSLNIRNISWHGFISINELTQNHIAILFIICATIGHVLNNKNIVVINFRPQITNLDQKISEIRSKNLFVNIFEHLDSILYNSSLISDSQRVFWKTIQSHTVDNCQNNCLVLFLPIFEHFLRIVFCKINNCHDRMMLASNKEKYVTLDDIFSKNVDGKSNKIYDILHKNCAEFYDDMFSLLNGLRIRDKLSHGEVLLTSTPCLITEILLNFFVYVLLKSETLFNNKSINNELLNVLQENFDKYESIYHPNNKLKYKIIDTCDKLNELNNLKKPGENEIEKCEININNDIFNKLTENISNKYEGNVKKYMENKKINCFFKPKSELKFVTKLTQIINEIGDICRQIIIDNENRYKNFINNTLGIRQINRYDEILKSITMIFEAMNCIVHIVVMIFVDDKYNCKTPIFKFLISTLNYLEKINKFSNVKINKWENCRNLTNDYKRQIFSQFYLQM